LGGVELLGGLEPAWYFTRCFSLYESVDIALAWGKHTMKDAVSEFGIDWEMVFKDLSYITDSE